MAIINKMLKEVIKRAGYQIIKPNLKQDHILRRMKLLESNNINLILDVGANSGQYVETIKKSGFRGKIFSFEPLTKVFQELGKKSNGDLNWEICNYGLGDYDGESLINISANSVSSSILRMLPSHIKLRPESKFIGSEKIIIKRLDSIFNDIYTNENVFLKIDAQGYEYNILEGASVSMNVIKGLQLEMSIEPLYEGEKLMCEMIGYLRNKGFKLMSIEPGSMDYVTGQMYQIDGIFFKES